MMTSGLDEIIVSECTGPVFEVAEYAPEPDRSPDWLVIASGVAVDRLHGAFVPTSGAGRSPHKALARRNALYECAERLALREPPGPAPTGETCPLDGRTISVLDLSSREAAARPAADFYLHPATCPRATAPDRPTSNGAAAGDSYWDAVERGLLELLERDALMTTWRFALRLPCVHVDDLVPDQAERLRGQGLVVTLVDLSSIHGVPVIVCVVRGQVNGRAVCTIGSAGDRTLLDAATRAAVEASSVFQVAAERVRSGRNDEITFADFLDHAFYYLDPDKARLLDSLDSGPVRPAQVAELGADSEKNVCGLAERLETSGITVFVADTTPAWLRPHGISTIAARSPDLYPLELGYGHRDLAHRLRGHRARRSLVGGRPVNLSPIPLA